MTSMETEQQMIFHHIEVTSSEPYLIQKLGQPDTPVLFTRLLYFMLTSNLVSKNRVFIYCVATAYLKMGLSIHERVTTDKQEMHNEIREQQLTILAGDFYSSLFYRCLSQHGEIAGMTCLANAAIEIFEGSMKQYLSEDNMNSLQREKWIVGQLLTAIADFFHVEQETTWRQIFYSFMTLDNLQKEGDQEQNMAEEYAKLNNEIGTIESQEVRQAVTHLMQEKFPEMS